MVTCGRRCTCPCVQGSSPRISFNRVLLPPPVGPTSAANCPGVRHTSRSVNTGWLAYAALTRCSTSKVWDMITSSLAPGDRRQRLPACLPAPLAWPLHCAASYPGSYGPSPLGHLEGRHPAGLSHSAHRLQRRSCTGLCSGTLPSRRLQEPSRVAVGQLDVPLHEGKVRRNWLVVQPQQWSGRSDGQSTARNRDT